MIGPVFFVLIETSIRRGIKAGISFNLGVLFSDIIYIALAYLFYSEVSYLTKGEHQFTVKIIGGVIFGIFGLTYLFKKIKDIPTDEMGNVLHNSKDYIFLFMKGFLLNIMNPLVIFYWFSIMTIGSKPASADHPEADSLMFFISILLISFFSFDLLKIAGAKKLKPLITENFIKGLNRFIGIVFLGFSIILIYMGYYKIV
jgi:threonine/homoserine/homoserine lactone efflux protein